MEKMYSKFWFLLFLLQDFSFVFQSIKLLQNYKITNI